MSNNLYKVEKDLRSIAKRYKSIKYSVGLAILFLMLGTSAFSEEVDNAQASTVPTREEIASSRENLKNSVGSLQSKIDQAKAENEKGLTGLKLELIQLMEQGDQVVKSPWASWQFGANYMYNKWNGTYKGRGDKTEKYPYEGEFARSTNIFERVVSPLSEKYKGLATSTNSHSASSNARNGLGSGYGLGSTEKKQEPLVAINIEASIRPKDVTRSAVSAPTVGVEAPRLDELGVPSPETPSITPPSPEPPKKTVSIVQPNASPFTGFFFDADLNAIDFSAYNNGKKNADADLSDVDLYSGLEYNSWANGNTNPQGAAKTGYKKGATPTDVSSSHPLDVQDNTITTIDPVGRTTNIIYRRGATDGKAVNLSNLNIYARGYYDGTLSGGQGTSGGKQDNWSDRGRGNQGGYADPGTPTRGTIGLHTLLNVKVSNVTANLYGRAGFLTSETWRSGTVTMNHTTVNVYNDQNSVFFIMPSAYGTIAKYLSAGGDHDNFYIGGLKGSTDVNLYGTGNNVYLSTGISGARHIENKGIINSDGASNIVYSGIGYVPDWSKTWYQTRGNSINRALQDGYTKNIMRSVIKLGTGSGSVNLYGDENVGLFFGSKMGGADPKVWESEHRNAEFGSGKYIRSASYIGIYQGEIELHAKIGEKTSSTGKDQVNGVGNIYENTPNGKKYDPKFVEGAVGIYSESGQREGIDPIRDLGVPTQATYKSDYANIGSLNNDKIHNLQVGKVDVRFGSKSKNGFMFISKLGTVMDIAKSKTTTDYISGLSTEITDGMNGENTTEEDASTGTTIAYAEGTWDQGKHKLGSTATEKANNDNRATGSTARKLQGLGSAINIFTPKVTLASKQGIAYMGDNKGIINVGTTANNVKTTAVNHRSIIGFARDEGTVTINGNVEAKDAKAKTNKWQNIAGLAVKTKTGTSGGTVTINGNVDVHGMAGFADGTGSVVNLKGTGNTVSTGTDGALAAKDGGVVNFGGGKITHKNNGTVAGKNDHESSVPFYADSTSKINFEGNGSNPARTTIEMADGVLMSEKASAYNGLNDGKAKYNGMKNVTVKLIGDNVILKASTGKDITWTGASGLVASLKDDMKLGGLDFNNHKYKVYYLNGTFKIDTNINLDDSKIAFHNVGLSNEMVTINTGREIKSTTGKGLAVASNKDAVANTSSGYINKGNINITGGSLASGTIGLNVSYGTVRNEKNINVANGIGVYGINGSKLVNETSGKINIGTQGVGMAGFASAGNRKDYGTDKLNSSSPSFNTKKLFEIENNGTIQANGDKSIGLYGKTNDLYGRGLTSSNGSITNNGKLILTGNNAVGIVSKRATVKLSGTGSSDIVLGKEGIGVYAENSPVTLNSNYGIEVKDKGTGIYVDKDSKIITPGRTVELKYTGSNTGTGVGLFYEGKPAATITNGTNVKLVDTVGTTGGLVGLYTNKGGILTNNGNISGNKGYGIITDGTEINNAGNITFNNPVTSKNASVGIYTKSSDKITNLLNGKIKLGKNSVGIYGKAVENSGEIEVGDGGTGIYSAGGNVNLNSGAKINAGADKAVAIYAKGANQNITAHSGSTINLGNTSFGIINEGTNNKITSNIANINNLGNDTVYIYSTDTRGRVTNNTNLKSTGYLNYGIYSAGTVENKGNIDFSSGYGNVGIYSIKGGNANNTGNITVGKTLEISTPTASDPTKTTTYYAIGMAAGYTPESGTGYTGNITNAGTINVNGDGGSIGMYGTERGTRVINNGTINLRANNSVGMYLDNGAYGENNGIIQTIGSGLKKVTGVVIKNGSRFQNNGTVRLDAESAIGLLTKGGPGGANPGIIENYGTLDIKGVGAQRTKESKGTEPLEKEMGGVAIKTPKNSSVSQITVDGKVVKPTVVETSAKEYQDMSLSSIGMYINTSGTKFTRPITGLSALRQLKRADLIIGVEAAQNTTSKTIQVGQKILEPYNKTIKDNPQIEKWNIYSGSLTWAANIAQNQTDGTIQNAYLAKIPYTHWAGNQSTPVDKKDTYNFLDGLEQRYGVEALGSRENQLFQKLNGIGKNEQILFFQAIDEMMGHQYANVQQRVQSTGIILDKEFNYLRDEWRTASKDSNKIKTFGTNGEYKTDTAGVIDYKYHAYGVAYVHENEDIKMGRGTGWYTGIVHNTFKFKDIGNSKEQMLQAKVGLLKSVPFDVNNSLNWTISGDIFVGRNTMHRKFLVVDEIFNAKSRYYTYGIGVKNEIGKEFRLSEGFTLRPYAALKLEYGRVSKIREKSGEVRLEVKHNDYFSVRPEIGAELGFKHYFGMKALRTTLGVAYENELGRVANGKNKARVAHTDADWFNIRGEKENRRGNVKFDLNVGLDNTRYGVTANIGYDTKGENLRGGLGLRVIF
ncbi:autotransporter-associated N-terminal domain-containing protein [Fusobacterium animalis]|uniref:autotransporter-associated N-terminal domain-containing protein n=1 Tax=Fusobacterium animalis TaxID=76859 RepID=UPI001C6F1726|nr:autotransporter-associated N-terminal domain-containing protein [Fusobacterium animalis]QYR64419.1 autotransporter-associated N-terminal domain-containing protein [Fusobacterium animalis]